MANNPFNQLFENTKEEIDVKKKIVEELLTNENLESKTELKAPLRWSCLDSIRDYVSKHNMPYSAIILEKFIQTSFKYLISNERKGRAEYIEALKALSNLEQPKPNVINPLNPLKGA